MRAAWILFRGLNLAYFRTHALRVTLSVAGISLGVMLLFGAIIDSASASGSLAQRNQSLQGRTDIEVTSAAIAGLPAAFADRARSVSGARVVAPVLQEHALIRGSHGTVEVVAVGYDDHLRQLAAAAADTTQVRKLQDAPGLVAPPQLLDEVGRPPARGELIFVSEGRGRAVPLAGEMSRATGQKLNRGHIVGLPLPLAQQLLNQPGRLSSLFIESADRSPAGVGALKGRLTAQFGDYAQVLDGDHTLKELDTSTQQFRSVTNLLSLLALLLGAYVAFITMSMAAVERRREFSIMLALGDSPRRLLARFLVEAALLGLAGSLVGLLAGYYVGRYLAGGVPQFLEQAYGFHSETVVPVWGVGVALLAGILAAVAAAVGPAVSILRLPPAEALRAQALGEAPRSGRLRAAAFLGGITMLAGGLAGALLFARVGYIFAGFTFVGAVLALPEVFTRALRAIARGLQGSTAHAGGGLTQIVGANLLNSPRRTVAAISAAALSLSLVVGFAGSNEDVSQAVERFASHFSAVDVVANASSNLYVQLPFSAAALAEVRRVPGVAEVYPLRFSFLSWHGRRVVLLSQDPQGYRAFDVDLTAGNHDVAYRSLAADGVLISTQVAQLDGLGVGDPLTLSTPAGRRVFHVGAVVEDLGWQEGVLIVGNQAFGRDFAEPQWNQLLVKARPGTPIPRLRDRIAAVLGSDAQVQPGSASLQTVRDANAATEAPFTHMRNVSVVVAILAVFNTLLVAVLQRRREIGVLVAIGLHRRQLAQALFAEASIMVALALLAGTALGVTIQAVGIVFLDATTGLPLRFHLQPVAFGIGLLSAVVIAVVGSLYPAREAARVPVLEAIAYE